MTSTLLTHEKSHFTEGVSLPYTKITILTPAHNEEDVIEQCILSIKKLQRPSNIDLEPVALVRLNTYAECTISHALLKRQWNLVYGTVIRNCYFFWAFIHLQTWALDQMFFI